MQNVDRITQFIITRKCMSYRDTVYLKINLKQNLKFCVQKYYCNKRINYVHLQILPCKSKMDLQIYMTLDPSWSQFFNVFILLM